jgi:hypothetical protein
MYIYENNEQENFNSAAQIGDADSKSNDGSTY